MSQPTKRVPPSRKLKALNIGLKTKLPDALMSKKKTRKEMDTQYGIRLSTIPRIVKKKKKIQAQQLNVDESGLFYKALPNHTLAVKDSSVCVGQTVKNHWTVMFFCNMDSTEKHVYVIVTVFSSMLMIKQTCESVTEVTIRNCFQKAHIMTADAEPDYQITFPSEIPITNIDEYVECDCGWECCVKLAIDEIVEDICKNNSDFNANKSTDNEFTTTIITHKEAVAALFDCLNINFRTARSTRVSEFESPS
ncbi:hypothetical protein T4E_2662 [Trichinella pseudospiralis]|uniref:DDE-1 domain-containing protein n=1 Tax=Trichinella pseudospiralis TaxID=6337 RepID=A0A0V0XWD6_TRIPS|nr:hypothetical protein T4E_2662 [Trichinella pseudospiralis]